MIMVYQTLVSVPDIDTYWNSIQIRFILFIVLLKIPSECQQSLDFYSSDAKASGDWHHCSIISSEFSFFICRDGISPNK